MTMRIAILGATGRIGDHLLTWALDAGHPVHALARDPQALRPAAGLTVTRGDALDAGAVADVIAEADAVLSALGPRGAKVPGLLASAASNIVAAMEKTGTRRLICVSAAGAYLTEDPYANLLFKLVLPHIFAAPWADVRQMEDVIRGSDLDWTLVRASRLVNRPLTGQLPIMCHAAGARSPAPTWHSSSPPRSPRAAGPAHRPRSRTEPRSVGQDRGGAS
jgi:putative NADH-flavin reductase